MKYDILQISMHVLTTLHKLHTWLDDVVSVRLVCDGGKPLSLDP